MLSFTCIYSHTSVSDYLIIADLSQQESSSKMDHARAGQLLMMKKQIN